MKRETGIELQKMSTPHEVDILLVETAYFFSAIFACAAERRAIGTRKGEQET